MKQLQTQVNRPPLQEDRIKTSAFTGSRLFNLYIEQLNGLTHLLALFKQACVARQEGEFYIDRYAITR